MENKPMTDRSRLTVDDGRTSLDLLGNAPALAEAILDRHLDGISAILDDVSSGLTEDELMARTEARRAAILDELVRPNGEAGRAAWEDACRRMADVVALLDRRLGHPRAGEPTS
jgi:hypothetical protein